MHFSLWQLDMSNTELYALLVKAACPACCNGVTTEENSWHSICENKAATALNILRGIKVNDGV